MTPPRFSVSEITTFHSTFEEDLAAYREGGAEGIGVWEVKLPEGKDAESAARLADSGLAATICVPATPSIYPIPFPGPSDPAERTDALCAAIRRFARFDPVAVVCVTGHPGDADPVEGRGVIVGGLRAAARVAGEHGTLLGLEPLHRELNATWSIVGTIPEALALVDEVGEPSLKVLLDLYHVWDTDGVLGDVRANVDRFVPSVHVSDWREPTRNAFDRVLPGDGVMNLEALLGALDAGGFEGWFDLEIFSDDGSFSDQDFDDSLWKQDPVDVVRRGKAGFERAWAARTA